MADEFTDSDTEKNESRYLDGKIYKLINDVTNDEYLGSSVAELAARFRQHKFLSKDPERTSKLYQKMREIGAEHFSIVLVEAFSCASKEELLTREDYHINLLKPTLNTVCARFNEEKHKAWTKEYRSTEKYRDQKKLSDAAYAERNKVKIAAYKKQWNIDNAVRLSAAKRAKYHEKKAAAKLAAAQAEEKKEP